jgi:hypothetical protein
VGRISGLSKQIEIEIEHQEAVMLCHSLRGEQFVVFLLVAFEPMVEALFSKKREAELFAESS